MPTIDIQQVMEAQALRPGQQGTAFKWKKEYVPFLIAGVGVALIPVMLKLTKKKRKRRK